MSPELLVKFFLHDVKNKWRRSVDFIVDLLTNIVPVFLLLTWKRRLSGFIWQSIFDHFSVLTWFFNKLFYGYQVSGTCRTRPLMWDPRPGSQIIQMRSMSLDPYTRTEDFWPKIFKWDSGPGIPYFISLEIAGNFLSHTYHYIMTYC